MALDDAYAQEERERDGRWLPLPEITGGEYFGRFMPLIHRDYGRRIEKLSEIKRKGLGLMDKEKDGSYKSDLPVQTEGEIVAAALTGLAVTKIRGVVFSGEELDSTPENIRMVLLSRINRQRVLRDLWDADSFAPETVELEYPPETVEAAEGN